MVAKMRDNLLSGQIGAGGSTSTLSMISSSTSSESKASRSLFVLPYAWALRLRRNKFTLIKLLLLLAILSYLIIIIRVKFEQPINSYYYSSSNYAATIGADNNIGDGVQQISQAESHSSASNGPPPAPPAPLAEPVTNDNYNNNNNYENHGDNNKLLIINNNNNNNNNDQRHQNHPKSISESLIKNRLENQLSFLLPTIDGWGENGKGVTLEKQVDKELAAHVFSDGAFNVYISDRISVNRSLKYVAAKECKNVIYKVNELPTVSVIIIFTNEIFSALIRTIWSVINRTPKRLLKEIILVDDFSDHHYLKQTLDDYIIVNWPNLVRVYRLPERQGLIKARLKGASEATGEVLLFLDSHCEVSPLWVEPLLARIKEDPKVFICPVIDIINDKTLEYNPVDPYSFQIGGFDWTGHFTWINRRQAEIGAEPTKPVKSPTMAGGLFAVDRHYFYEMGSYDDDMQIWGGENLEVSFRVWQCGGRVEIHPCSHVGHIFRDYHPYSFDGIDSHGINTVRTVRVWMEDYTRYFFLMRPDLETIQAGDVTKRLKLKRKLKCGSFKKYLDEVYDGRKFIYDQNVDAYGFVRNPIRNLCIDTLNRVELGDGRDEKVGVYECDQKLLYKNLNKMKVITNQLFSFTSSGEIRREMVCLTRGEKAEDTLVYMIQCEDEPEFTSAKRKKKSKDLYYRQRWRHHSATKGAPSSLKERDPKDGALIINQSSDECLTTNELRSGSDLRVAPCDSSDPNQRWQFSRYTPLHREIQGEVHFVEHNEEGDSENSDY